MKLKIKIKKLNKYILLPEVIDKGEFIDLRAAETVAMDAPQAGTLKRHRVGKEEVAHRDVEFDFKLIPLGVAIQLPKGFKATVVPRSSTYMHYGITQVNSVGVIDSSYCGNTDEWKMPVISYRDTVIPEGTRICQFEVTPSQKATVWQKLKWLFCSGIKIIEVDELDGVARDGFGSTGTE